MICIEKVFITWDSWSSSRAPCILVVVFLTWEITKKQNKGYIREESGLVFKRYFGKKDFFLCGNMENILETNIYIKRAEMIKHICLYTLTEIKRWYRKDIQIVEKK